MLAHLRRIGEQQQLGDDRRRNKRPARTQPRVRGGQQPRGDALGREDSLEHVVGDGQLGLVGKRQHADADVGRGLVPARRERQGHVLRVDQQPRLLIT